MVKVRTSVEWIGNWTVCVTPWACLSIHSKCKQMNKYCLVGEVIAVLKLINRPITRSWFLSVEEKLPFSAFSELLSIGPDITTGLSLTFCQRTEYYTDKKQTVIR